MTHEKVTILKASDESRLQDLEWAIGLNRFSLRWMGVWPDDDDLNVNVLKTILRIPLMIAAMFFFIFVPQMYALLLVRSDMLLIIDNFMTSCPAFVCCLKLFFLWHNKEVLRPVVSSLTEDWLRPKGVWVRNIMRTEAALAKLFTFGGYVFIGGSYVGFVVFPLFGLNIRLHSNFTDYGRHRLLVQSYYPYNYATSPNFELTHISQVFAGVFIAMSLAIPDNYFGALVFHLSAQFEILGMRIEHFIREDSLDWKKVKNKMFSKKLGVYVNRHVHLIRMVAAIEKSFTFLILSQLFCMCVMACCLGFRILYIFGNPNEEVSIFQLINLAAALLSLMLFTLADCSASENLNIHSMGLFDNVYNCKWYMVPEQSTRDLILMMVMSKNPQALTAGKFMYLSMLTYCSILKTIAGYLSVLVAVSG